MHSFFMRAILGACLLLCLSQRVEAQAAGAVQDKGSDTEQIAQTLTDYMEGTANGEPDKLRRAFHPDFKLYTTGEADELIVRSGEQYIAGFKPGQKNSRVGRIISIDVEKNIATAKVEVRIPDFRHYTDYFMLLKYAGAWKIVQKSYIWEKAPDNSNRILFVTSSQHTYGKTGINAANHFAEIVVAYDVFKKHGYAVDFVSPDGGAIPLGYIETSDAVQKKYLYDASFMALLKQTFKPEQVQAQDYRAVYYSGGGSAMFGVADNKAIQGIAESIYRNNGIVSAICHGTAGIVHLKNSDGKHIFADKKITGFPDLFEDTEAPYYKSFPYSIDKEITRNGGNFIYSKKWNDNFYVVDGRVITGQDPSATASVAEQVIKSLQSLHSRQGALP